MTPEELVYTAAIDAGVDPAELWALWQVESGGSIDTKLRGEPTKHGQAIGPWQIMPFHNPPADFPGQTNWAAKYWASGGNTLEDRVRRYYGAGTPLPGHPTQSEYANRIRKFMAQSPYTMRSPMLNPQVSQRALPSLPRSPQLGLLADPFFMAGMGILSSPRRGMGDVASGALAGLGMMQNYKQQQAQFNLDLARTQAAMAPKPDKRTVLEQQLLSAGIQPGSPQWQQAILRYLFTPKTQVNVGTGESEEYPPPGDNTRWVNPKDPSKGYYEMDPETKRPAGPIQYLPGSSAVQPTSEESKLAAGYETVENALDALEEIIEKPNVQLTNLPGAINQLIGTPNLTGAAFRSILSSIKDRTGVDLLPNEDTTMAMIKMARTNAAILNILSGQAATEAESQRIRSFTPVPGDSQQQLKLKIEDARLYLKELREKAAAARGRSQEGITTIEPDQAIPQSMLDNLTPGARALIEKYEALR